MSRASWKITSLLVLLCSLAVGAAEVQVVIVKPSFLHPVFGEVEFEVEVESEAAVAKVEFLVDGKAYGEDAEPPFATRVDVGQRNRTHRFEAVVHLANGETVREILETPAIQVDEKIDLGLQQLYVTVTDGESRVLDLPREAFRVVDDGRGERLVTFEHRDVPLTAVLLLDVSASMRGRRLEAALSGARAFLEDMRPLDEAMVLLFSDRVVRATEFSENAEELAAALEGVETVGGTALNDHLYLALNYLDGRQGRRVVVLLSDGVDILSVLRMREVMWRARHSQALIYWIHLAGGGEEAGEAPRIASAWRDAPDTVKEFETLLKTVEESGGRADFLSDPGQLEPTYREILQELREQYALGYYPTQAKKNGKWRPVEVRVDHPRAQVRAREGYLDY